MNITVITQYCIISRSELLCQCVGNGLYSGSRLCIAGQCHTVDLLLFGV